MVDLKMTDKKTERINFRVTPEQKNHIKKTGMTQTAYAEYAMDQLDRSAREPWKIKNPHHHPICLDEDTDAIVCKICDELNIEVDQALSFISKLCFHPDAFAGVFAAIAHMRGEVDAA